MTGDDSDKNQADQIDSPLTNQDLNDQTQDIPDPHLPLDAPESEPLEPHSEDNSKPS